MRFERLPISSIVLDKSNPRIAHWLKMYNNDVTQEQLYLALGVADPGSSESGPSFHSLKEAIKTNKGVIHPILVNKRSGDSHIVIEGNTRLAIYIDFYKNHIEGDWSTIPCIVYDNLSDAEVDAIRLQAHLVGVRQWDPYSKAKYLAYLRNCQHLTWNQIIDYCGGKKREAEDLINAYNDMETYYRPILEDDGSFDPTRFSGFVELQKPNIKESIIKAGFDLKEFAKWINDRLIFSRLENVRYLPAILGNKRTREAFLAKGDKAARAILDAPLTQVDQNNLSLDQIAKLLAERLRKINLEEITKYKENMSSSEVVALLDAKEELEALFGLIKSEN